VDEWEIRAGDSLVQKIFEEGIGRAAVVIVVLSPTSVTKKWVKDELDAAVVNRINQTGRLIPIIIEECEIPVALRATKWIRFDGDLKAVVDEVLRAVFGKSKKPPLGSEPKFVHTPLPSIPGLDNVDIQVLHAIGEHFFQRGSNSIDKEKIVEELRPLNISLHQIDESLEILSDASYISPVHSLGQKFTLVRVELLGAETALRQGISDYDTRYRETVAELVNKPNSTNESVSKNLSLPLVMINHVFDDLESQGLIKMSKSIGGPRHVYEVSARLNRMLRE
jgi:hypothetical protein